MGKNNRQLIDSSNLRGQTYKILKNIIITREILPGKKISEETLVLGIGVSRTPIREALSRLEHEGILKIIPRRAAFVVKPSKKNIIAILQVREVLEALIVRLVTPLLEEPDIPELRSCLEKLCAIPEVGGKVNCNIFAVKERFLSLWHRLGDIFNTASENMAYIA